MTFNHSKTARMFSGSVSILAVWLPLSPSFGPVSQVSQCHGGQSAEQKAACHRHSQVRSPKAQGVHGPQNNWGCLQIVQKYASPALYSSISSTQNQQLENVPMKVHRVILGPVYNKYDEAITTMILSKLFIIHGKAMEILGMVPTPTQPVSL